LHFKKRKRTTYFPSWYLMCRILHQDNSAFLQSPFTDGTHKETIMQLSPNYVQHIKMKEGV